METIAGNEDVAEEQLDKAEIEVRHVRVGVEQHRARLDLALVAFVPEFSRSYLKKLINDGAVSLDGVVLDKASARVQVGQELVVELRPTPDVLAFQAQEMTLDVVFEDEHLMIINKPAGLVVHPGAGNWSGTLLNGLLAKDVQAKYLPRAGIVHRLDKDTSGLLVVGKTLQACMVLSKMMADRVVERKYLVMVQGAWGKSHVQLIDAPIGRDMRSRIKMAVHPQGKEAQTHVELIASEGQSSLLLCQLHTGRTHQIRVHLMSQGYPLVSDVLYGGQLLYNMDRHALHAFRLSFRHPVTSENLVFTKNLPADFMNAVKMAGLDAIQSLDDLSSL